jgi:hypothetical protein
MSHDDIENEFRKKSQWFAFKSQTWGSLGMACFLGAVSTFAMGMIAIAAGIPAITAGGMITPAANILGGGAGWLWPNLVTAGLGCLGIGCTYLSQREATELRIIQDEHIAYQTNRQTNQNRSEGKELSAPEVAVQYEQNRRQDGKNWLDVVKQQQEQGQVSAESPTRH